MKKTTAAETTFYLWAGDRVLAEYGSSGAREMRYAYSDRWSPDEVAAGATLGTETRRIVEADRLATPRLGLAASGVVQWRGAYEAYGRAHVDPDPDGDFQVEQWNVRLPGQYFDSETDSHFNRERYFETRIGRYSSADPIQFSSDRYGYARQGPTRRIDPLGLWAIGVGLYSSSTAGYWGAGVSGSVQVQVLLDSSGNVGIAITPFGGSGAGVQASTGVVLTGSNSDEIYDMEGPALTVGGSAKGGGPSVDLSIYRGRDGNIDLSVDANLFPYSSAPTPELHAGSSRTFLLVDTNLPDILETALDFWRDRINALLGRRRPCNKAKKS